MAKITSVAKVGKIQTYDLEVDHPDHQFYLSNDILTSNSHATSYSITSYQCAYLLKHYPDEWVAAYIDYCATEKGTQTGKESPLSVALSECRGLGYEILKPDINISEAETTVHDDKKIIPSFRSLKNLGLPSIAEIKNNRPYEKLEDFLWDDDERWRHRKFNKKALSTLVKLGALDSLGLVGENKMFKNYRQVYHVLVEKNDELKRANARKKNANHKELLQQFIEEAQTLPDWTTEEKIAASQELAGFVDIGLIITPELRKYLAEQKIDSVDNWENEDDYYWAIVRHSAIGKTKTGKSYLKFKMFADNNTEYNCFMWGFIEKKHSAIEPYTLILGKFKKSDFGFSTFPSGVEIISTK